MKRQRTAFTIVELMVSIAIIFLLVATALVALKAVRRGSSRVETQQALRQMLVAYSAYSKDYNGRLMPGHVDPADLPPPGLPPGAPPGPGMIDIRVRDPRNSANYLNEQDAAGYVWRLVPYLSGNWKTLMTDYRASDVVGRMNAEADAGHFGPGSITPGEYGIGLRPSFGLNSAFLGGDSYHGGAGMTAYSPWNTVSNKPQAAIRESQVKSPAKITVFAPTEDYDVATVMANLGVLTRVGYVELRAPFGRFDQDTGIASLPQWKVDINTNVAVVEAGADFTNGGGLPVDRLGEGKIALGHLDGSVELEQIAALVPDPNLVGANMAFAQAQAMGRWSPFAVSAH